MPEFTQPLPEELKKRFSPAADGNTLALEKIMVVGANNKLSQSDLTCINYVLRQINKIDFPLNQDPELNIANI